MKDVVIELGRLVQAGTGGQTLDKVFKEAVERALRATKMQRLRTEIDKLRRGVGQISRLQPRERDGLPS